MHEHKLRNSYYINVFFKELFLNMVKFRLRRLIVIICLLLLIPAAFVAKGSRSVFGSISHSSSDLVFDSLATRWDEGMPLGNAVVGELVWRRSGALRLSVDRTDLWDLRPVDSLSAVSYTHLTLPTICSV